MNDRIGVGDGRSAGGADVPGRPPEPLVTRALAVLLPLVVGLVTYGSLFSTDVGALRADYGRIFLPPLFAFEQALAAGELLLWDPSRYGGTPYWSVPNAAPAWPPLVLGLALFGPVGALNLNILVALVIGAVGTYRLARTLGAGPLAAGAAAALFLHTPFTRLLALELPYEITSLALAPFAFLLAVRVGRGADWRTTGIGLGLLWALVPWSGGYILALYGLPAIAFVAAVTAIGAGGGANALLARGARVAGALALTGLVFAGAAAARLIPIAAWSATTDRAEGVPYELSLEGALSWAQLGAQLWAEGAWVLLACGVALAVAALRRNAAVVGLAVVAVAACVLATGAGHRWLHEWLPGFDRLRGPSRVLLLLPALLPALAGYALAVVGALVRPAWRGPRGAAIAALGLAVAFVIEPGRRLAPEELQRTQSLSERLDANALHAELARRAGTEDAFRVVDFRSARAKRKRTADLIRAGFGLDQVEGMLGNVSVVAYDSGFMIPAAEDRARVWGLAGARYVTSDAPLDVEGLEPEGVFARDPAPLYEGQDGPYLYRNVHALPRAYRVDDALAVLDAAHARSGRLLARRVWDPRRQVLVRASVADLEAAGEGILDAFVGVVPGGRDPDSDRWIEHAHARGVPIAFPQAHLRGTEAQLVAPRGAPLVPLSDPVREGRTVRLDAGAPDRDSWLVVAEAFALYGGWSAKVDGRPARLWPANGAATALRVPAGAREVELRYLPPGLVTGLVLSAATLAASLGALVVLRRRRVPAPQR